MKVIMYMAMSANGIIARENGQEDLFSDYGWWSFKKLSEQHGCFIIGRKTFDSCKKYYKNYSLKDVKSRRIIVSKNTNFMPDGFEVVNSPLNALKKVTKFGLKSCILCGGGINNSSFMNVGLVDEIILDVEPVVVGKGIHLFAESKFENNLDLIGSKKLKKGIVRLHYRVLERRTK